MFVDLLEKNDDLSAVPGLTLRRGNGNIISTPVASQRIELDFGPRLPRDLLGKNPYYNFKIFHGRLTAQVQTMRGCPYKCSFCNQRNQVVNAAAINYVVDELSELSDVGYEAVFFDDATFTVNQKRTSSLVRAIRDRQLTLQYAAQTRSECVSEPLISEMAKAGFTFLSFGLETVDENVLVDILKSKSAKNHISSTVRAIRVLRVSWDRILSEFNSGTARGDRRDLTTNIRIREQG